MRLGLTRLTIAALMAIVVTGCSGAAPAGAKLPRTFVGILAADMDGSNVSVAQMDREFAAMQRAGVGTIRHEFDAHVYSAPQFDAYVLAAARHHIHVVPLVVDRTRFRPSGAHRGYTPPPATQLASYASSLAGRYGPHGTLWRGANKRLGGYAVRTWQIWNEPNLPVWFQPKPNPAAYAGLVKVVSKAIRSHDRKATIVSAGIPDSTLSKPYGYKKYLAKFLKAGGGRYVNAVGIHAYSHSVKDFKNILKTYRTTLNANRGRKLKMLITEVGWADKGHRNPFVLGSKGQAKVIKGAFAAVKQLAKPYKIAGVFYFKWRDVPMAGAAGSNWGYHTGLLGSNGHAKPAYNAFVQAVRRLER